MKTKLLERDAEKRLDELDANINHETAAAEQNRRSEQKAVAHEQVSAVSKVPNVDTSAALKVQEEVRS